MTKRLKNLLVIVLVTAAVSFSPDLLAQEARGDADSGPFAHSTGLRRARSLGALALSMA